jgi:hypothetical protein
MLTNTHVLTDLPAKAENKLRGLALTLTQP